MCILFPIERQEWTRNGQNIKVGTTKLTIFVELERIENSRGGTRLKVRLEEKAAGTSWKQSYLETEVHV